MRQTFTPQNLITLDGVVAAVIGNGSAFVHTAHGDQIYVPSRQVAIMGVDVGDGVRCWCLHNEPEHSHTAQYRSVRGMVTYRLADSMGPPKTALAEALGATAEGVKASGGTEVAEKPTAPVASSFEQIDGDRLYDLIDGLLDQNAMFSTKEVHAYICGGNPRFWGDAALLQRITNTLNGMHSRGEAAAVKVYRDAEQTTASAVMYCRSAELAVRIMAGLVRSPRQQLDDNTEVRI